MHDDRWKYSVQTMLEAGQMKNKGATNCNILTLAWSEIS